ncbi:hypothetical protein B0H13DRAFT_1876978 [Mycena leptocephala]|nr:hypothetical protein B0H13DRAFT_1876978 [Mycena leptocephala]
MHAHDVVAGQATPSASTVAPARTSRHAPSTPVRVSDPARPWAGRVRARRCRAGTVGGGLGPVRSALPVRLGSHRRIAAVVDAGGGVWALGQLRGRASAGSGAVAEDVFVGGVALGAGRSIHPRRDEMKKT